MMKYTKKFTSLFLSLVLVLSILSANQMVYAANTTTVNVIGTYNQTEARNMLSGINSFRKGTDAWYWSSNNKSKTICSNLKNLSYDYELEKIAMLRAAEVATVWSHTRPSGQDCFTAYTYNAGTKGENIAAGPTTYDAALKLWREDNEKYSGQGHRRNILSSSYSYVGIGHFVSGGIHFWVQEFASKSKNTNAVAANNNGTTVPVSILTSSITAVSISPVSISIDVINGTSVNLPSVTTSLSVKGHWPAGGMVPVKTPNSWTSSNSSIATISGYSVYGKKVGTTTMTVKSSVAGKTGSTTLKVNVNPVPNNGWVSESGKKKYYFKNGKPVKYRNYIDGKLYYFNGTGVMQTGWIKGPNTFYADADGVLRIGWASIAGKKYYFKTDSSMAKYTNTINGKTYYFNSSGVMHTGWLKYNSTGKWSYFDQNGVMLKNTTRMIGNKTYYFDKDGSCKNH